MTYITVPKAELEVELESSANTIRLILEEFSRRDSGAELIDHHARGLAEVNSGLDLQDKTNAQLAMKLYGSVAQMAFPALVWESRFKDASYTQLIYSALQPVQGQG